MLLTKSKYLAGLQCPRYFWTKMHNPEELPKPDARAQHRFDEGNIVGELAKKLYPKGKDIPTDNYVGNLVETEKQVAKKSICFEAGFQHENLYIRADYGTPKQDKLGEYFRRRQEKEHLI